MSVLETPPVKPGTASPKAQRSRAVAWGLPLGVALAILLAWQLAETAGLTPRTIPGPIELVQWFVAAIFSPQFLTALWQTISAAFISFVITAVIGIVIGTAAGLSRSVSLLIGGVVEFFRPIPSVVYLPLVLLLFGLQINSVIILVIGGAIWPIILQTAAGVADADPVLLDAARVYRIKGAQRLRSIIIPGALPFVATGLRVAATMAIVITVTVELLGTGKGLGGIMSGAYVSGAYVNLFGAAFTAAALGLVTEQLLAWVERRVLHWHPSSRLELQ